MLLLAGLPGNLARLEPQGLERFTLGRPRHWSALGQVVRTDPAPAGHHPEPFEAREVTVGWLRSVEREGKMPILSLTPAEVADAEVSLAIRQVDLPASRNCRRTGSTQTVRLSRREVLAVDSPRLAVSLVRDGRIGGSTSFLAWDEESVAVAPVDRSLVLRLDPQTVRSGRPRVCQ